MPNTDIRLAVSFRGHRKRKKLNYLMGIGKSGTDYLIDLWISVANDRPDGVLMGWDELDIALAAEWEGDANEFAQYLIKSKWLDYDEKTKIYSMHDWAEYQAWACNAKKRSDAARKNAQKRWEKRLECEMDANCNANSCELHKNGNAPSPNPSPNPSPKYIDTKTSKKKFKPPTVNEVISYFKTNGYSAEAGKNAFDYYVAGDWHDSEGKPVKSWKQKMRGVWFRPENKIKEPETFGTSGGLLN